MVFRWDRDVHLVHKSGRVEVTYKTRLLPQLKEVRNRGIIYAEQHYL